MVSVEELLAVTQHPKMVGIGETGLDYHYTAESAGLQKQSLAIHIEGRTAKPATAHYPFPRRR